MNDIQETSKGKSMFKHPERLASVLIIGGIVAVIGVYVLPFLTLALTNMVYFGIACAIAGFLAIILFNKRLWSSVFYLSDMLSKKALGIIIEMDPFIIAEKRVANMVTQQNIFSDEAKKVLSQKELLNAKINERMKAIETLEVRARTAKNNNMPEEFSNIERDRARKQNGLDRLIPLRNSLEKLYDNLIKIYKKIGYTISDTKSELEDKKDLFASLTAGRNALSTALKIFKGDPDEQLRFEQSMEWLNNDMAEKLASMKQDYTMISDFTNSIDLDNATYEQKGLDRLENLKSADMEMVSLRDRAKEPVLVSKRELGKVDKSSHMGLLDD